MQLESNMILQKASSVIVNIAKRDWPLQWQNFQPMLLSFWVSQQPTAVLLSLNVLKGLIEDVYVFVDPVADLRRNDLRLGLGTIVEHQQDPEWVAKKGALIQQIGIQSGDEGWLRRLANGVSTWSDIVLDSCIWNDVFCWHVVK